MKTLRHRQWVAVWTMPMHFFFVARCGKIMIGLQHMHLDIIVCLIQRFHQLYVALPSYPSVLECHKQFHFTQQDGNLHTQVVATFKLGHESHGVVGWSWECISQAGFGFPMANDSNELSIQSPSKENCRYRYYGASYTPEQT